MKGYLIMFVCISLMWVGIVWVHSRNHPDPVELPDDVYRVLHCEGGFLIVEEWGEEHPLLPGEKL